MKNLEMVGVLYQQRPLNSRILEDDSLRGVYLGFIRSILDENACSDTISKLTEKYRILIDSCVKADSNKLHTYGDFLENIKSDVYIVDNMSRVNIPGLTSFCSQRSAALNVQLEKYTPVLNPPFKSATESFLQFCFPASTDHLVRLRYALNEPLSEFRIEIVNMIGKVVCSESATGKPAGVYELKWNSASAGHGVFAVRILSGKRTLKTGKFMVVGN